MFKLEVVFVKELHKEHNTQKKIYYVWIREFQKVNPCYL